MHGGRSRLLSTRFKDRVEEQVSEQEIARERRKSTAGDELIAVVELEHRGCAVRRNRAPPQPRYRTLNVFLPRLSKPAQVSLGRLPTLQLRYEAIEAAAAPVTSNLQQRKAACGQW